MCHNNLKHSFIVLFNDKISFSYFKTTFFYSQQDLASLQFIGSQNRALKYFGGSHSNSLLILFPSTEDTMKVKGHLVMNNMQCELLDNATANKELQTGAWSLLPPAPSLHHHQNFLARQMYNSVRY